MSETISEVFRPARSWIWFSVSSTFTYWQYTICNSNSCKWLPGLYTFGFEPCVAFLLHQDMLIIWIQPKQYISHDLLVCTSPSFTVIQTFRWLYSRLHQWMYISLNVMFTTDNPLVVIWIWMRITKSTIFHIWKSDWLFNLNWVPYTTPSLHTLCWANIYLIFHGCRYFCCLLEDTV